MIRSAFTLKVKLGKLAEYRKYHDEIWPELVAEIKRSGIKSMTSFERDSTVFYFSETESADSWERLWNSEVHQRWAKLMGPLIEMRPDGKVDSASLMEIFHLETGGE